MALELKKASDGRLRSAWWYGRYEVGGKKYCVNLGVKIKGPVPADLRNPSPDELSPAFVRSRTLAQAKLEEVIAEARSGKTAAVLARKVYEMEAGAMLGDIELKDLPSYWAAIPRKRKPKAVYIGNGQRIINRFVAVMAEAYPRIQRAGQVTPEAASAFMRAESERGVVGHTWNESLSVLKGLFTYLQKTSGLVMNPFAAIVARTDEPISREPFTQDDINAILEAAATDALMRPLIVTALCTAMRRGDCCLLKWKDVDLKTGFITVKSGKTGEVVEIPILPMLHAELTQLPRAGAHVFPEIAKLYQQNPDGVNYRLSAILERAGFVDPDKVEQARKLAAKALPALDASLLQEKAMRAISETDMLEAKRERMRACFQRYSGGMSIPAIARELALSKGTVSGLLNELERLVKAAVIRRPQIVLPETIRGDLRSSKGEDRLRRASIKGWHSFRTTWITMALSAGVPEELVRRVSGHTTVDIVRKHYFRPGREQFKQAMMTAMPKLLTNGGQTPKDEMKGILTGMTAKTLKQDKARLLELLAIV